MHGLGPVPGLLGPDLQRIKTAPGQRCQQQEANVFICQERSLSGKPEILRVVGLLGSQGVAW